MDFLVFTDDCTEYNYPDNVKVHYMSFEQMKELFQKHYDFPLSISAPYKFCDFRPAFGEIFLTIWWAMTIGGIVMLT